MKYIKLKRTSKDIMITGKKGVGKTMLLSLLGYLNKKCNNALIYSNYPLSYDHIRIENFKDFNKILEEDLNRKKIFLADDFEFWYNSREIQKNISLNNILLFFGKANCSIICTAKREMALDKALRETISEFWEVEMISKYYNKDYNKNKIIKQYLNNVKLKINRLDHNLNELETIYIDNIQHLIPLFDTQDMVKSL